MKKIYQAIQPYFISLNSFKIFQRFGRLYYYLGLKIFIFIFRRLPEIKSIYIRHSFALEEWVPWVSDIDLTVVTGDMDIDREIKFLNKFWLIYRVLNIPFPFINHIDIFKLEEFKSDILYEEPLLSVLISSCKLLYGNEYRKIINYTSQNIFGLLVQHWLPFMQWFYKDNFHKKLYVRKYYIFLNRLLYFAQERNINTENLKILLSYAQASNFWLRAPAEFVFKVFFYSLNILSAAYRQQANTQMLPTKFKFVDGEKDLTVPFLGCIGIFVNSLSQMKHHIRSIFIDPGSTQHSNYRMWIILDNHIEEKDFINFSGLVKENVQSFLKMNIYPYIFLEGTLNFFLTSRWFWPFEYYHLKRHAQLIFGEDLLTEANKLSDKSIIDISYKSGLMYKYRSRNLLNNFNQEEYLRFLLSVISRKIFLDKMIVTTTQGELTKARADLYASNEIDCAIKCINKKNIDKAKFYSLIESLLRNDSNRDNSW